MRKAQIYSLLFIIMSESNIVNKLRELTKLVNESNGIVKWLLFSQITTQMNMSLGTSLVLYIIVTSDKFQEIIFAASTPPNEPPPRSFLNFFKNNKY